MDKRLFLTGNQAIARGAWEAGVDIACAYPGTPSTEILEDIRRFDDISSEWSVNEKVAYEVAYGAAVSGKRALVCMKQVGLNVAADPFFTSVYTGVNAGLVIVCADEPGVFSSQNEQDNRNYGPFAKIPILEPADSEECRTFIKEAFKISERFDTPVMIRLTTRVCHTHTVTGSEEREKNKTREYSKDAKKRAMIPVYALKRHEAVEKRLKELQDFSNDLNLHRIFKGTDDELCVITSGIASQYALEVGENIPILKLGMSFPLPEKLIMDFTGDYKKIVVIEENDDFLFERLHLFLPKEKLFKKPENMKVNELNPGRVREILSDDLQVIDDPGDGLALPPRPPQMCPGCPHRGTFFLLNKYRYTVNGDIGCYGLGVLPPFEAMDTIVCMGASVSMAHGFDKAGRNTVGVIGDSTFFHTGINSLINSYYNNGKSAVMILDNSITAMTGGQINPSSANRNTREVSIENMVRAIGIEDVRVIDAYDYNTLDKEIRTLKERDNIRVLIIRQPCVMIRDDKAGDIFKVDRDECINCGLCHKTGCPAISVDKDGKPYIIPGFCFGCGICSKVCPKGAIKDGE